MNKTFEEFVILLEEKKQLWVELLTGVPICIIDIHDKSDQVFVGTYVPCVQKSRTYPIKYSKIKCIRDSKFKEK